MRISASSRSAVTVTALVAGALVSAIVTSAAAVAASAPGVTRESVLAVAGALRARPGSMDAATTMLVTSMTASACSVTGGETVAYVEARATAAVAGADGVLVLSAIRTSGGGRTCDFAAVAATDVGATLTGTATITGSMVRDPKASTSVPRTNVDPLSGTVAVTTPVAGTIGGLFPRSTSFTTTGSASRTVTIPSSRTVVVDRTAAEVAAAKKAYAQRVKKAKKTLSKASGSRRAAARKTFKARKAAALATYRRAVAPVSVVRPTTTTGTDTRSFSLGATATRY